MNSFKFSEKPKGNSCLQPPKTTKIRVSCQDRLKVTEGCPHHHINRPKK